MFSQKQHDDYFSDIKLISFYFNAKLDGILVTYQTNLSNELHATIPFE